MKRRGRAARGVLLAEVLAVLSAGTVMAGVAIVALIQTMHLHGATAAHLDRQATAAALSRQLRMDACAAIDWQWDDATLVLSTVHRAGRTTVSYRIAPDNVARCADAVETHLWRSRGLSFSARVEAGATADVLLVDMTRSTRSGAQANATTQHSTLSFLLPTRGGAGQ